MTPRLLDYLPRPAGAISCGFYSLLFRVYILTSLQTFQVRIELQTQIRYLLKSFFG